MVNTCDLLNMRLIGRLRHQHAMVGIDINLEQSFGSVHISILVMMSSTLSRHLHTLEILSWPREGPQRVE